MHANCKVHLNICRMELALYKLIIIISDSQIDKPQRGHPKRAELSDVNIRVHKALTVRARAPL